MSAAEEAIADKVGHGRKTGGSGDASDTPSPALAAATPAAVDPAVARTFVDAIVSDPRSLAGRSAEELAAQFTAAGFGATVVRTEKRGTSGNAVQVRVQGHPEITNIQVHPGGGRHTPEGSPYWKISTNTVGRIWVVPRDFRGAESLSGGVVRYDQ